MLEINFYKKISTLFKARPINLGKVLGACVIFWSGHLMAQSTDSLLDFSLVMPPQGEKIKLKQPEVNWLVRADAPQYCEKVPGQDGFAIWQEGCVHWSKAKPSCTIVTTSNTTHSQLGRLFLYCMHAGEQS